MNSWRPYPLLRLVFPFMAGIIAENFTGFHGDQRFWLPALLIVLLLLSQLLPVMLSNYRLRWITGLSLNIFLLLAGYEIASYHRSANDPDFLGKHPDGLFIATITEPPSVKENRIRVMLKVQFHAENNCWVRSCGSAVGYLKFNDSAPPVYFGDYILLHERFTEISDNSNPNAFNYSRYLKNKDVLHRVFAESHCWKIINIRPSGLIRKAAFQIRDRLLNILRYNHVEGREFAVASALLLGYVDDLDAGLRKEYAATGAMHILSVSGMHVGIIYLFLEFLLGFLNKSKAGRMLKAVLLLGFIWFYAMLTGLSPCVLRSAAMLSLPILGKSLSRSPDMYNIMAASMIFILSLDPLLILDVGFQLSYLAVGGIVVLYKPIYDLYVTSSWLPDKIWSILAVSIAAQIATLPITLFTFHQFPNYFMLTNIFVVPLSSLIIYFGILVLVVGYVPVVCIFSAKLLIFLIWLLNGIIHFIEQMPFSVIRGIFISIPEMLLLYLVIASAFLFFTGRRIYFLYLLILSAIVLNLLFLDFRIQRLRSSRLTVFNVNRDALYMFSAQDKAVLLYHGVTKHGVISQGLINEAALAEINALGIHDHRDFWLHGRERPPEIAKSFVPVIAFGNFIQFAGSRIAVLSGSIPKGFAGHIAVDLLIITDNPKIFLADAIRIFHPREIIVDATNSRFKTMQWMKEAANSGVKCHAVTEKGAFQKEF
ncbi:MAG: ComEC/Rec2 family competence protein [Bacteroidetes bacterium]|nr:ComEC/Rec2 family competence protein [Bacteroidota bacterium]